MEEKTVRLEMICWSLEPFPKKHRRFVPLPYPPENNYIPVQTPPSVARDALRTIAGGKGEPEGNFCRRAIFQNHQPGRGGPAPVTFSV